MTFLPATTILGQLEILEVYDFYDKPVFFSCKNRSGLIFFVLCVDSSDFAEVWLYAPANETQFLSVTKDEVEPRDIFAKTEDGFVYQVEIPFEPGIDVIVQKVKCIEIPEDYLPVSDNTSSRPNIFNKKSLVKENT